ncbi:MAG: DUF1272 domain-containing protein [Caulobacterales bacterium]
MLAMRPNCACCDKDLPADQAGAFICSFECTYCADCAGLRLLGVCPNCGGGLVVRPPRAAALLTRFPAEGVRQALAAGCGSNPP